MTNDEAIRILRKEIECLSHTKCEDCILEKVCDPMKIPTDDKYIEIYEMAIKALDQKPCDCIDRTEAQTEIMMFAGNEKNNDDIYIKVSDAVELLRELPSVIPIEPKADTDCISRQAVLDVVNNPLNVRLDKIIEKLPSVVPIEPKTDILLNQHDSELNRVKNELVPKADYKAFAEWVASEIFTEEWEYNKDAFAEIACRKLSKLGLVMSLSDFWKLKESEDED